MREHLFAAHHALEERHWWFRARRKAICQLGTALLPDGGQVVDVGCGTGADIAAFSDGYTRHGIDRSETAISYARERYAGVHFHVAILPGTGPGVDALRAADVVLLCDVLEHIKDDSGFMEWLISTMKAGSHLLVTVPADMKLWSPHDDVYGHRRRYAARTLAALWESLPVQVKLLAPFNRILYPIARLVRAYVRRGGHGRSRERGDLMLPWTPVNRLLESLFALEVPRLREALAGSAGQIRGNGVSLIAVLQKHAG